MNAKKAFYHPKILRSPEETYSGGSGVKGELPHPQIYGEKGGHSPHLLLFECKEGILSPLDFKKPRRDIFLGVWGKGDIAPPTEL